MGAQAGPLASLLFELKFWVRYVLPTSYVAVFYPSPPSVVARMLSLAECTPKDTVFDLGCGDGRVLVAAAKLGAKAVGYELDSQLVARARAAILAAGLDAAQARVVQGDAGAADVSSATVIALYLSDRGNRQLMQRLITGGTLQPGTRVVSNFFEIEGWEALRRKTCTADPATGPIHLYTWRPPISTGAGRTP